MLLAGPLAAQDERRWRRPRISHRDPDGHPPRHPAGRRRRRGRRSRGRLARGDGRGLDLPAVHLAHQARRIRSGGELGRRARTSAARPMARSSDGPARARCWSGWARRGSGSGSGATAGCRAKPSRSRSRRRRRRRVPRQATQDRRGRRPRSRPPARQRRRTVRHRSKASRSSGRPVSSRMPDSARDRHASRRARRPGCWAGRASGSGCRSRAGSARRTSSLRGRRAGRHHRRGGPSRAR